MEPSTKVNIKMGRSTATGSLFGMIKPPMTESSNLTILKDKVNIFGRTEDATWASGRIIKCTERGNFLGLMARNIKVRFLRYI